MDRYLVISSDGHAGPHAAEYRDYVDPEFRDTFDVALPIQIQMTEAAAKSFLVDEINKEWRKGRDYELSGAWNAEARDKVLDADGVAAEVLFPDGVTEMNAPPFGAGFSMAPEGVTAAEHTRAPNGVGKTIGGVLGPEGTLPQPRPRFRPNPATTKPRYRPRRS